MANVEFAEDWVTSGWSRHPNTREWAECGASKGITVDLPALPPELGIHDVADALNLKDAQIEQLIGQCAELLGLFGKLSEAFLKFKEQR